jgi:tetratricopeptide (TPR) repeat protein
MKCPNCGTELEDGKLLCENCGEEIKIVPDYDIELEDQLKESLSSMLEDMENNEFIKRELKDRKEKPDDFSEADELDDDEFKWKNLIIVFAVIAIFVVVGFMKLTTVKSRDNSYEYQYNKAIESAAEGNYTDAASYLERALALEPDDIDSRFLLAKYYDKNGGQQSAIALLEEILKTYADYSKRDEVYDTLLGIYQDRADYDKMGELLKTCDIERILTKYNKYAALSPTFNKDGGIYDRLISISISGNTKGFVYYTTDGSVPTSNSPVYETPILLESGEYVIKAMFVNLYGVESDVVTQNYYINLSVPDAPLVQPESGTYSVPSMIEAYYSDDINIYYTTDGSTPDKTSNRYNGELEMPYGISNFSFIVINASGVASEVVSRTYRLEIQANFSTDVAITVLKNSLWAMGALSTADGNVPGKMGLNQYSVSTLYGENDMIYYIVKEEYVDTTGTSHETGNFYAINVDTADLYTAYKVAEGQYNLVLLTENLTG